MGAIETINQKLIKLFSFTNKDGKVCDINTYYGQNWSNLKTDNQTLNSIFSMVDNGDGVVQAEELNVLSKILNYIDGLFNKDEVLDEKEINEFKKQLDNGAVKLEDIKNAQEKVPEKSWSEGLDRNISTIQLSKTSNVQHHQIVNEMKKIGEEQGFDVELIESGDDVWIEDSSIRRADGKKYVPYYSSPEEFLDAPEFHSKSARGNQNNTNQGRLLYSGSQFDLEVNPEERFFGTSYLEGGNVLNTKQKDGTPAAVVGESSINITLTLMGLENTPENVEKVKNYIARDLGLENEQVTYIPQHDFHIDMSYRPLHNGEFAVPDYEQGLVMLKELREKLQSEMPPENQNEDSGHLSPEQIKLRKLDSRIKKLEQYAAETKDIREEAGDYLAEAGYKIVKIPAFATETTALTNYMNGIGGTSTKTGQSFYITNKSEFPELDAEIEEYLKKAGIDKVYFVSTQAALNSNGGIDCLTQEK